ncbi:unnamed protein product [Mesocestoides corti]|uniref:BPTI/Kunitz inhibitor domain-containing protein n=1 Tax=Mesocestoides corti TaxID=53468 RepID=A0A0R3UMJ3_MESCO|nr:unnamed protein product [Mesocestoides corti]
MRRAPVVPACSGAEGFVNGVAPKYDRSIVCRGASKTRMLLCRQYLHAAANKCTNRSDDDGCDESCAELRSQITGRLLADVVKYANPSNDDEGAVQPMSPQDALTRCEDKNATRAGWGLSALGM